MGSVIEAVLDAMVQPSVGVLWAGIVIAGAWLYIEARREQS